MCTNIYTIVAFERVILSKNWYCYVSFLCENYRNGNDKNNYVFLFCPPSTLSASASTIAITLVNIIVFGVVTLYFFLF